MAAPLVEIYGTSLCGPCERARRLLRRKGVEFEYINLEEQPQRRAEMLQRCGRRSVPQIFIAGQHIGGFDELSELEAAGGLDRLLAPA
jgi:glutaredoxin 3